MASSSGGVEKSNHYEDRFFPRTPSNIGGGASHSSQATPRLDITPPLSSAGGLTQGISEKYKDWEDTPAPPPASATAKPLRRSSTSASSASMYGSQAHLAEALTDQKPFDEEFQRLIAQITDDRILREETIFRQLSRLARDFRFAAITYGKVIIAEKFLPPAERTIKPRSDLPGFAGGDKFVAGGILFRFAVDRHKIYGDDESAGKEAAHQLRGLTEVASAGVDGLHFPLMALIDYRGYRLVAVSRLPISGKDTLLVGSQDAGTTVLEGNDRAKQCVTALAKTLNLREHRVKDKQGNIFTLQGPIDFEIHQSAEGRLYALDFARLMPPEPPHLFPPSVNPLPRRMVSFESDLTSSVPDDGTLLSPRAGGGEEEEEEEDEEDEEEGDRIRACHAPHLVRLLRPELVRTNPVPLSSDAFSTFGALDREVLERDVEEAGTRLVKECIPAAANAFVQLELAPIGKIAQEMLRAWGNSDDAVSNAAGALDMGAASGRGLSGLTADGRTIVSTMHKNGVNMRHLGRVAASAPARWQKQLLNEAISRCIKVRLRAAMRQTMRRVRTAVLTPFLDTITDKLNLALGAPPCTRPSSSSCSCNAACLCLCICASNNNNGMCGPASVPSTPRPEDLNASFLTTASSPQINAESALEQEKARWWCHTLPQWLQERFGFGAMRTVLALQAKRDAHSGTRCQCCACGFARVISRPTIFARVSETCGLVLSPPLYTGVLQCLARLPSPHGPKARSSPSGPMRAASPIGSSSRPTSPGPVASYGSVSGAAVGQEPALFDLPEPFEEGSIVDALGQVKMLPFLDYATGTTLLIKARNMKNSGVLGEALRLGRAAKESYDAGLAQCPTDSQLLCNLGFLMEDVLGKTDKATEIYEESVKKNPLHARSHYYLALCLQRKYQKNAKHFQAAEFRRRAKTHFKLALECSPRNANILKDYARFLIKEEKSLEEGERLLERALEAEPGHFRASEALWLLYDRKSRHEDALKLWRDIGNIRLSLAESAQARVYLVQSLLGLKRVAESEEIARALVQQLQGHRLQSKGHSERPNSAWACKMSEMLTKVAVDLAKARGTRCCDLVHHLFEVAAHILSWFLQPTPSAGSTQEHQRDQAELQRVQRKYSKTLFTHGDHVVWCDCEHLDKVAMAQQLTDDAVRVDPHAMWPRKRFEELMEGGDSSKHVIMYKRPAGSFDDAASLAPTEADDSVADDAELLVRTPAISAPPQQRPRSDSSRAWSQVVATGVQAVVHAKPPLNANGTYSLRGSTSSGSTPQSNYDKSSPANRTKRSSSPNKSHEYDVTGTRRKLEVNGVEFSEASITPKASTYAQVVRSTSSGTIAGEPATTPQKRRIGSEPEDSNKGNSARYASSQASRQLPSKFTTPVNNQTTQ